MKANHKKCLVLNADYLPLCIVSWTKAIIWHMKYQTDHRYGVEILDFYKNDHILGVNNKKYPIPAVVKTNTFIKTNKKSINFSRKNIFIRDNFTCQYCGNKFDHKNLTYDHVIPKSLWDYNCGSPTIWTNITTACIDCNRKKGNKTPSQAKMPLLTLPYAPNKSIRYLPIALLILKIKEDLPKEWEIYLPESYKNL